MTPDTSPIPSPNVVATKLADGAAVLLDLDSTNYIHLNKTAAFIWSGIENGESIGQIAQKLATTFDVGEERAIRSATTFAAQLVKAGLATQAKHG